MNLSSKTIGRFIVLLLFWGCYDENETIGIDERCSEILIPDYYSEHIKAKEQSINEAIDFAKGDFASLLFFTDAHWGANYKNSPMLINHIIHNTPINDVVFGGDVITTSFAVPKEAYELGMSFRSAFDTLDCNLYYLYGNHDNNSDCQPTAVNRHLSDEQVYDYLQSGMSVCDYGGFFNFFFDREKSKTRFICLDTGRFYYSQFRGKTMDTIRFLTEALNETPDSWRIVILSHLWYNLDYETPREPYMPNNIKTIVNVLDDYNANHRGVFAYNGETIEYDFSNASSKIVCCIGGHCHIDSIQYSDGNIPIIITTTDSTQTVNEEIAKGGTVEEQALSVFIFDYSNQALKMFRVGRGKDIVLPLI